MLERGWRSTLIIFWRMSQERPEFFLVQRLFVRLLRGNAFHSDMLHDGVVQWLVPHFFADLDHAWNLMRFALAHQVGDGGGEDKNFQSCYSAFLIDALEQVLSDHPF